MSRLSEITVLVTGALSPLGIATIGRLVAEGAHVVAAESPGSAGFDPDIFGPRVSALALDVTDPENWQAAAEQLRAQGPLHGVVNSSLSFNSGPLADCDEGDLRTMIDVNMLGPALAIRSAAPLLAEAGGGSIVNLATSEALRGAGGAAVFAATNWAIRGLTRSAALELGPLGIRVNTVCAATELFVPYADTSQAALADEGKARAATFGDVAAMIAFLLSDDSATCTAGDFVVDAGA